MILLVKREKIVLTEEHVASMYKTMIDAGKPFYALIILILARMGLREAELVGQRPEDAFCRCALCKLLKREINTGIKRTKISPEAAEYIRTWSAAPKGKPRGIKFKQEPYMISVKDLDTVPEERIPFPLDLLPQLQSYVAIAHFREPMPGLRVKDIDFARNTVKIYGKGWSSSRSPERTINVEPDSPDMGSGVLANIRQLIEREKLKTEDRIIPLSTRRIREIIKEAALVAGIPDAKDVAPHRLRAFYITQIIVKNAARGDGLKIAQEQAGHADSATTMLYQGVTTQRKQEAIAATFKRETGRPKT